MSRLYDRLTAFDLECRRAQVPASSLPSDIGVEPRLLNVRQAASYIGVSAWTIRDWLLSGVLTPVRLPALVAKPGARQTTTLRRALVDRADLDALVDRGKQAVS